MLLFKLMHLIKLYPKIRSKTCCLYFYYYYIVLIALL